jgi:hypothetical protein
VEPVVERYLVVHRQSVLDGVPNQEQARVIEGAGVQQAKRAGRPGLEGPDTLTDNASADHEMQLIDQAGGEKVVPEDVTAKY